MSHKKICYFNLAASALIMSCGVSIAINKSPLAGVMACSLSLVILLEAILTLKDLQNDKS